MAAYRNIPIKAITKSATREAEDLGINLDDIANLLAESYDCKKEKRREGIKEICGLIL